MNSAQVQRAKQAVRERVWDLLEREGAAPSGVAGHIPDFVGSDVAAIRLTQHTAWQAAHVVKAVPDLAQLPVRVRALEDGKHLYMASPKLATEKPFFYLDPASLAVPPLEAAAHRSAAKFGQPVDLDEMPPIDLVVCGSVAVNRDGVRLGKGAGYADVEVALLQEAGLMSPHTLIATTVHSLQVVDEALPDTEHDFRVDLVITPDETFPCEPRRPRTGIIWEQLTPEFISAIPALVRRSQAGNGS
ncbi:5-formyltetrahydrofolate cyclo-ligase [Streptomyces sp. TS71-3]|uniref:5-formyltetrahydrofolate cyclo-ligase n=1 Tax=Streptomyces sp. TS71-3 TaxID=2733862 RepID=UPI001B203ADA|nr:5-formyltetrahydrofolate cyclo-ligase [Streptomyces sp. TS71-3]GHJ40972.1 5-formyltetrahydrofolate cyclo-ligase [Streptomyces sp. TS71-3]